MYIFDKKFNNSLYIFDKKSNLERTAFSFAFAPYYLEDGAKLENPLD